MVKTMTSIYYLMRYLNRIIAGEELVSFLVLILNARMFRVGILKFIDSYSFLTMSLDKIAKAYNIKNKTLYPYEYLKDENSYNNKLGNLSIQDFRSTLTTELPTQDEVDEFNNSNSKKKTGNEITLEYMENYIFILGHSFNLFVKLNMNTYKLNPLRYISLPSYSFDCFLKQSKVELDTIQWRKY